MKAMPELKPATYQDIIDLPEHVTGELIDGELYAHARPALPHTRTASYLQVIVAARFQLGFGGPGEPSGPGGWCIVNEPELHLDGNVFVPDIAGWRASRMPSMNEGQGFRVPPDWVCEVLSPSTRMHDRLRKSNHYARLGIPHMWIVDPVEKTLEVYEVNGNGRYELVNGGSGSESDAFAPFQAVPMCLAPWWGDPMPGAVT